MPAHITKINFAAQLSGKIDKQNNRLLGVTVMAANREATGHGEWADEQTLRSLVEVAKGVYPSQFGHPYYFDTIQPVIGSVSNFRIYDNKVIADIEFIPAADLHPSFVKSPIDYIFEMAQNNPEYINLSVSISRELVWIKQDGTEQDAFIFDNPPVDIIRKIPSIRVKKLHSVDFVTKGALTESLFSAKQGTEQMENGTEQAKSKIDLAAQVKELKTYVNLLHLHQQESDKGHVRQVQSVGVGSPPLLSPADDKTSTKEKAATISLPGFPVSTAQNTVSVVPMVALEAGPTDPCGPRPGSANAEGWIDLTSDYLSRSANVLADPGPCRSVSRGSVPSAGRGVLCSGTCQTR